MYKIWTGILQFKFSIAFTNSFRILSPVHLMCTIMTSSIHIWYVLTKLNTRWNIIFYNKRSNVGIFAHFLEFIMWGKTYWNYSARKPKNLSQKKKKKPKNLPWEKKIIKREKNNSKIVGPKYHRVKIVKDKITINDRLLGGGVEIGRKYRWSNFPNPVHII